ncbi:MAG: hypothetical protein ACLGPL_01740 [Acidobacteriota bacterium]
MTTKNTGPRRSSPAFPTFARIRFPLAAPPERGNGRAERALKEGIGEKGLLVNNLLNG